MAGFMKRRMLLLALLGLTSLCWGDPKLESSTSRRNGPAGMSRQMNAAKAKGIPEEVLENAGCVALVRQMTNGGSPIGAEHGRSIGTCRIVGELSAPEFLHLRPTLAP